jgi:hypothetical protein
LTRRAQTPSILPAIFLSRKYFRRSDSSVSLLNRADIAYRHFDFFLPLVHFGDDSGDGPTLASDDDGFATFYFVEEPG